MSGHEPLHWSSGPWSGSRHLDRAYNDKFSVECMFWFFQPTQKSDQKVAQITKNYLFCFNAPL